MIRQKTLVIRTPEGIVFPLVLASPISRFLALAVDLACIYVTTGVISTVLSLTGLISPDIGTAVFMLASAIVSVGYPMLLEWRWRGQTIGKKLLRLQVMDGQGLRLQASQIVIRNLLRGVDALPGFYGVGGAAAFFSIRGQRLGDLAANTIVVRHPEAVEPDFEKILPGKYNSFREHPHLAARLRQNVTPREAGLALEALLRRAQFEDNARPALFAEIRAHFEQVVRFPPEATDGLSDEQYVRNVADVLFR
jgi:uncharacterized RDD family membrane protein YckC